MFPVGRKNRDWEEMGNPIQPCPSKLLEIDSFRLSLIGSEGRPFLVLDDISLVLNRGRCLGIAGESGSGKSVLALCILKLLPHSSIKSQSGTIFFDRIPIHDLDERGLRPIRGNRITMVFQEPMTALNPLLSLSEQIREMVLAHSSSLGRNEVEVRVERALINAGFPDPSRVLDAYPHQLSGGMRQRAMLAMAIVMNPDLIIADEPTTALDAALQVQLLSELRKNVKQMGNSLIFISHDLGVIRSIADDLAILYSGQIMEKGNASEILSSPAHPYTLALIGAMPRLVQEKRLPKPIPGTLPSPDKRPFGCVFSDRCKKARPECCSAVPSLRKVASERFVRCLFPENQF